MGKENLPIFFIYRPPLVASGEMLVTLTGLRQFRNWARLLETDTQLNGC
jgi:hypothetical protein